MAQQQQQQQPKSITDEDMKAYQQFLQFKQLQLQQAAAAPVANPPVQQPQISPTTTTEAQSGIPSPSAADKSSKSSTGSRWAQKGSPYANFNDLPYHLQFCELGKAVSGFDPVTQSIMLRDFANSNSRGHTLPADWKVGTSSQSDFESQFANAIKSESFVSHIKSLYQPSPSASPATTDNTAPTDPSAPVDPNNPEPTPANPAAPNAAPNTTPNAAPAIPNSQPPPLSSSPQFTSNIRIPSIGYNSANTNAIPPSMTYNGDLTSLLSIPA